MATASTEQPSARRLYRYDHIYTALPSPESFSGVHMREFQDQGFVAVQNIYTEQQVGDAKQALTFLIGGGNPAYQGCEFEEGANAQALKPDQKELHVRKVEYFVNYDARLKRMSEHPTLVSITERLLGSKVHLIQDMALLKPPHVGREKPWHQDNAYFLCEPVEAVIGTWIALDAATPENGCMHVIPQTHKGGPRPHYHDRDCQLPDDEVDVDHDVVVPLRPGGVLFFSGLLHHGTPPNTSTSRRRALQFHYAGSECRTISAERHAEMFRDVKGGAGCIDWTSDGKAGRPIRDRVK